MLWYQRWLRRRFASCLVELRGDVRPVRIELEVKVEEGTSGDVRPVRIELEVKVEEGTHRGDRIPGKHSPNKPGCTCAYILIHAVNISCGKLRGACSVLNIVESASVNSLKHTLFTTL
jgi:hypothetical protein